MTYNPYFSLIEDNYEGAKYSAWIVHHNNDSLVRGDSNGSLGTSTAPSHDTTMRTPFRTNSGNIETLMDPFGDGISVNSSDNEKLMLPVGKYWLDWRIGLYNGENNEYVNWYYYFGMGIGGYSEAASDERWIARGGATFREESTRSLNSRSICGYYESTSSNCYILCLANRVWATWYPGGTPTINKDATSTFGVGTKFPYGESRLLVMRLE